MAGFEPTTSSSRTKRATGLRYTPKSNCTYGLQERIRQGHWGAGRIFVYMQKLNLPAYDVTVRSNAGKQVILDTIRQKFVPLTPEEWVRQHFVQYLIHERQVPQPLIALEMAFAFKQSHYRADIVVYNRAIEPVMIVECKRPSVRISQQTFDQIGVYNLVIRARYLVVTNGLQHYCCQVNDEDLDFVTQIPTYSSMV